MKIKLIGKNALIGASSKGLGKAIALQLAKCGASVTLVASNENNLNETFAELDTSFNQNHQILKVDYTDFEGYNKIITGYFETNNVDILVNNTQGPEGGNVDEKTTEDYQQAFDLLFKTTQLTTTLALKKMKEQGFGRIINCTSVSIKEPLNHLVLSNSIRAAIITWAKTLANSVAKNGITVNNILTGIFDTERIQSLTKMQAEVNKTSIEEELKKITESIPVNRIGKPEEFAYLVTFLASEYSSFITGTNIAIDGGMLKSV